VPTFGSLFSGIGGMDLGLEWAGWECRWQVEIDDYCRRVLERHWPDVPRYGDVRDVTALPYVDLIAGGFPCQDISVAGKGVGIEGSRSGLWGEFNRLIRVVRPRFVLVENVPALLGRGLGRVLGDLAESGYDAEWDCIPAAAVGAPHLRDRIFIVAYADSNRTRERYNSNALAAQPRTLQTRRDCENPQDESANTDYGCQAVADAESARGQRRATQIEVPLSPSSKGIFGCGCPRGGTSHWQVEPNVGRMAHGIPATMDRLKGLGNAVVPQVAEWIGRRILKAME